MAVNLFWSDLQIEQGQRDPLGVWRVGGRMIASLLGPFTTVVMQRPARYMSMYCWILLRLGREPGLKQAAFWGRFYVLEGALLCAIQRHTPHQPGFGGQIGSGHAASRIRRARGGVVDLSRLAKRRIPNGWDANYKNPMQQLGLTEHDFGVEAGLKLTDEGERLAQAYEDSIQNTAFFREYTDQSAFPLAVLDELAQVACPCLMPTHKQERNRARQLLLYPPPGVEDQTLWDSMRLILTFARHQDRGEQPISLAAWRQALTCDISADGRVFSPSPARATVWRRWKVYALDALLTFALESGLQGFLEVLQKKGSLPEAEVDATFAAGHLDAAAAALDVELPETVGRVLDEIACLEHAERLGLEQHLFQRIRHESSGAVRVAWAYLLFLHALGTYRLWAMDPAYSDALAFYEQLANQDGRELALCHIAAMDVEDKPIAEHFRSFFLRQGVIQRQLEVRSLRRKEVAWFSRSEDFRAYDWEAAYTPGPYRAARFGIYLSFLHNLKVIQDRHGVWHVNQKAFRKLGV